MKALFTIVIFAALDAFSQPRMDDFMKISKGRNIKIKQVDCLEMNFEEGKPFFHQRSKEFYDKHGNEIKTEYYDSSGNMTDMYIPVEGGMINDSIYYSLTEKYKFDLENKTEFKNWKKKLLRVDTTFENRNDEYAYYGSYSRKTGRIVRDKKNRIIQIEFLLRHSLDSVFHLQERQYFVDSELVCKEMYEHYEKSDTLRWTIHYNRDSLGRVVNTTMYDIYLVGKPSSNRQYFYNQFNLVQKIEDETITTQHYSNHHGQSYNAEILVHTTSNYYFGKDGLPVKLEVYRNNILRRVETYRYKYY
jgi:hypothetical protein